GEVALCFSEGSRTVINGEAGNGVGVTSGFCATGLALGGGTADCANACAAAIWIPHIATAIQVGMCSSFLVDPPPSKEPLRQLRDVLWVLNQIANPNSAHINPMFALTRKR